MKSNKVEASQKFGWYPQAENGRTALSTYLRAVLKTCGLDAFEIFDSLDGCRLVRYQAVVRRAEWPESRQALEPLLKEHKAAYRRHYGGTGAPYVQADVRPLFERWPAGAGQLVS